MPEIPKATDAPLKAGSAPEPVAEAVPETPNSSGASLMSGKAVEPTETIDLPAAPVPTPVEAMSSATPVPAADPALPEEDPATTPFPQLTAEQKKMAALADSIRGLNEQIRIAQENAEHPQNKSSRAEKRKIERLKADRDELSRELTTLGKP